MLMGSHVSIAGGLSRAPSRSKEIGGEVFQIFSRSPRGGKPPKLTKGIILEFKSEMKKHKQAEAYIHTPYYINLASTDNRIRHGSIAVIKEELARASSLGIKYVMTHLGSANDLSRKEALIKTAHGLKTILEGYRGRAVLLLENSAGSGKVVGNTFEELAELIKALPARARVKAGICFDTCHGFASGYDLRTKKAVDETLKKFSKLIGLSRLKLIHLNDSKTELNQRVDRHEHIGQGKIGLTGFKALINHSKLKRVNLILETPIDSKGDHASDLKIIKSLRK